MAAADIYAQCLLPLKEGYPLYRPGLHFRLDDDVYEAYRRKGISIGDVGIIRPGGDFDFLFNICGAPNPNIHAAPNIAESDNVSELAESSNSAGRGSLSTVGISEQLRMTSIIGESESRSLANPPAVRDESVVSEGIHHPTPASDHTTPTGFELINSGRISTTPNYVSRDRPYLAHGREERSSYNVEASFNPIA
jgi:hypothetical protein